MVHPGWMQSMGWAMFADELADETMRQAIKPGRPDRRPPSPVFVEHREAVRDLLRADPVRNGVVIHRVYHHSDFTLLFADALPNPTAVLALAPSGSAEEPHQFALHARSAEAAQSVLRAVPRGACVFHAADEIAFAELRRRIATDWWGEALLYRLDQDSFRDAQKHDVKPVTPESAEMIAKLWAPDWPAAGYVRSRIENGPTAGIYADGELVAWDMTHLETDDVIVMGFLHVLDAHRGKGYAKSASSALAKGILTRGKTPTCHVYTDNEVSIRLTESLGFRRVCLQVWGSGVASR